MNRNWNRTKTWLPSLISICSLIAAADLVHQMADFCIISCWFALIAINWQQGLAVSPAFLLLQHSKCWLLFGVGVWPHCAAFAYKCTRWIAAAAGATDQAAHTAEQHWEALCKAHSFALTHSLSHTHSTRCNVFTQRLLWRVISFTFVGQKLLNLQATPKRCSKHVSNESKNSLALSVLLLLLRVCSPVCCRCRCFVLLATSRRLPLLLAFQLKKNYHVNRYTSCRKWCCGMLFTLSSSLSSSPSLLLFLLLDLRLIVVILRLIANHFWFTLKC